MEVQAKFAEIQRLTKEQGNFALHLINVIQCIGAYSTSYVYILVPMLGSQSKEVKKLRAQLFEEFLQCDEDWSKSTMVVNSTKGSKETRRGVYKLMSRLVSQLQVYLYWKATSW